MSSVSLSSARERFGRACRGEPVDRAPVWLMRQAGRVLPEYREIRAHKSFLEACNDPDVAVEISLQPYRRFGMDGVVVFSDIMVPLTGLGLDFEFNPGPSCGQPLQGPGDLHRLEGSIAEAMEPTCEAIRRLRAELGERAAVIGFAGAPWTLAAYSSEVKLSRDVSVLCGHAWRDPGFVDDLLARMARVTAETLRVQMEAGADALQIFDTWAGILSRDRFQRFAGPALRAVLAQLPAERPPIIVYARGAPHLLDDLAELGVDVVSLDWRSDLGEAAERIGQRVSLQGNLDPAALRAHPDQIRAQAQALLKAGSKARGHVLNLGHGVQPGTPIEGVAAFVEAGLAGYRRA